jgi:hypothetical protein
MNTPYVNSVGISVIPASLAISPRHRTLGVRIIAAFMLMIFGFAVLSTTVLSVGSYCLTSDGGDIRNLDLAAPPP